MTPMDELLDPSERSDPGAAFQRLVRVMARLREPGGCPWDREQTLASLRPYLLEEAYEVLEAVDSQDADAHREELGDLLLQVVFQSRIRQEEGAFDAAAVAHAISDKLVRRHPHVFSDGVAETADQVVDNWEAIKRQEKKDRKSSLDGVPGALPALARAQRLQEKAARVGFDWPDAAGPLHKLAEEVKELEAAMGSGRRDRVAEELGDVLFSVVNLARHLEASAEDALREAAAKFERRFRKVEARVAASGRAVKDASLAELDDLWEQVKSEENGPV